MAKPGKKGRRCPGVELRRPRRAPAASGGPCVLGQGPLGPDELDFVRGGLSPAEQVCAWPFTPSVKIVLVLSSFRLNFS